jgi:hypothetical protein
VLENTVVVLSSSLWPLASRRLPLVATRVVRRTEESEGRLSVETYRKGVCCQSGTAVLCAANVARMPKVRKQRHRGVQDLQSGCGH